jgi:hypothetical protein
VYAKLLWTVPMGHPIERNSRAILWVPADVSTKKKRRAALNAVYTEVVNTCLQTVADAFPTLPVTSILDVQSKFPENQTFYMHGNIAYAVEFMLDVNDEMGVVNQS